MIGIHQSQFAPWIPYFFKILKSDTFVILDDVQYQKNGVQNRNQVKTPKGAEWLTVPVKNSFGTPINATLIAQGGVGEKLLRTIEMNYKKSAFFDRVYHAINKVMLRKQGSLHELNADLLSAIFSLLEVRPHMCLSSTLSTTEHKDDLVIEIIKQCNETEYLSGSGALAYMDLEKFKKAGIKVYVQNFNHTEYPQLWNERVGFLPRLSIIDLLFNNLDRAVSYIKESGTIERVI